MNWVVAVVCGALGGVIYRAAKDIVSGIRDGWRRSGKSFRDDVRDRVQSRREGSS